MARLTKVLLWRSSGRRNVRAPKVRVERWGGVEAKKGLERRTKAIQKKKKKKLKKMKKEKRNPSK